jgi:YjbE family integral membrane protein
MSDFGLPDFLGKPLSVLLIDLLLAGDNALVIALVCQTLPVQRQRLALGFATLGAIVARVLLVSITSGLLAVPGLKLAGGLLLALLAVNLASPEPGRADKPPALNGQTGLLGIALLLTLVDVLMSLDNVLALAAVAGDSTLYLALGLVLSVALLMFGSTLVGALLRRYPELNRLGIALLGWVAGKMLVSDPLLVGWISQQAPALPLIVPALAVAYVYLLGWNTPDAVVQLPAAPVIRPPAPPPRPIVVEPPAETEEASSSHPEIWLFVALFVMGSLVLGLAEMFGGELRF